MTAEWTFAEKVRWIELMEKFEEIHSIRPLSIGVGTFPQVEDCTNHRNSRTNSETNQTE